MPSTQSPPDRLAFVDGFRGMAALMILLYHAWLTGGQPFPSDWNPFGYGYSAVHLFLVISGFCIYWPFARKRSMSLVHYARRRFVRIAPPFYAAVILWAGVALLTAYMQWPFPDNPNAKPDIATLQDVGIHFLFIHNLFPDHAMTLAGPFWSIGLEVQFYLLMPVLVFIAERVGMKWAFLFALFISLVSLLLFPLWVPVQMREPFPPACFARWAEFALGMLAAQLVADNRIPTKTPWLLCGVLLLVLAVVCDHQLGRRFPLLNLIFSTGYFFIILAAISNPSPTSPFTRILQFRPLMTVGTFSYSLYLIHQPPLNILNALAEPYIHSHLLRFLLAVLIFAPIAMAISYLFYLLVERHFINSPRTAASRKLSRPAPSPLPHPTPPLIEATA